jgi:hypothetical protein
MSLPSFRTGRKGVACSISAVAVRNYEGVIFLFQSL